MKKMKKVLSIFTLLLVFLTTIVGCGAEGTATETLMKDRAGNEFKIPTKVEKIVSTAPSNTEILVGLGLGDKIIAADKYSQDIEGIKKEVAKFDFRAPDVESLIALNPDIIIASTHNKVGDEDPFKLIKEAGITVVYVPTSGGFEGIYEDINFIGKLTGTEEKANGLVSDMKEEIAKIKAIGDKITEKKKVYFEIGSEPTLFSFGNNTFLNSMIEIVGAENVLKDEKEWVSPTEEAIVQFNPDVILTNEDYLENPVKAIKERGSFKTINAVKNNEIFLINGNSSSRPSQYSIKALKEIGKAIYPEFYEGV